MPDAISLRLAHPERPFKPFVIISHVFVRFHKPWEAAVTFISNIFLIKCAFMKIEFNRSRTDSTASLDRAIITLLFWHSADCVSWVIMIIYMQMRRCRERERERERGFSLEATTVSRSRSVRQRRRRRRQRRRGRLRAALARARARKRGLSK